MEFVANFELNNNNLDASFDLSEGASFDALFEIYASGTTWGSIDGNIENQTDLYNILMSKADKTTVEADLEAINDTITENYETLDNKIDSVQSDLSGDISTLSQTVINNNTAINNRVDNIVEGFDGDIEQINSNISDLQTTVSDNYSELNTKIQNEAAARTENDNLLQGNINTLSDNLTAEISNRESADSGLQIQITNLTGTVSSNYNTLNNSISNLSNTVDDLSDTVDSNYNILDTKINTTQTTLQGNIDTLSGTVTSNYNDLTQSITNNVSTLNTRITNEVSTLNGAISNEATARANADNNLQTQIDAIVSSSDVFDIVGTYAELQAYDISTVPVNDIIKVLVDSTHNNAATYYRCVENAGVKSWSYIGSEGAYYTKGEADSTFVPQTRTINNKALNQNINLTASDVGALPVGTQIGNGTILLTQGGVQKGTFTLNQTGDATIDFDAVSEDITVDSELSTTSTNPVQNKVITNALNGKQDTLIAGTDLEIVTAQAVRLPQGYTELKYVQSDGDCYIDTGIVSNLTDTIEQKFQKIGTSTTTCCWFGSMEGNDLTRVSIGSYYRSADAKAVFMGGANYTQIFGDMDTNPHIVKLYYNNGVYYSELDGDISAYTLSSTTNQPTINAWLFARHGAIGVDTMYDNEGTKIFYHKQKRANGTSLLNLVPAKRDSDDEIGFYDLVSNTFKTNSGTGTLIGGEEVVFTNTTVINFTNDSGYISSASVSSLTDVTLSSLTNGQGLIYNSTTQKWENGTIQSGGSVTDVEVNGDSVLVGTVAEIDLTGYQEKLTAGTDLEIIAGSGAILPDTYEELEYIQSDGDCYIDTGIVSNLTDTIEQKFQKLGNSTTTCCWFGSMEGTSLIRISIGSYLGAADQQFKFLSGFNYTQGIGTADTNEHVIKLYGGSVIELDGTSTVYTPQTNTNPTVTSYLFARHGYYGVNTTYDNEGTKIFYHKQKRVGGTELLDLVPARRIADGKLGFYNLVNNTFLPNSGTGTLTGGNVVIHSNNTVINFTNDTGYITGIDSTDVTTALGYTPADSSSLATVATTGDYDDLLNKPTIPTVNDGTLTVTQDGSTLGTFTANQSGNTTIDIPSGGASRNIGEIIQSTIPLSDAGLHLLDGALLSGSGAYADFVDYIADLYDNSEKSLNTISVGTLTNTNGIISGFSDSDYAYMDSSDAYTPTDYWEFCFKFNTGTNSGTQYIIGNADTSNNLFRFWLVNNAISWAIGGTNISSGDVLDSNTEYSVRVIRRLNPDYSYRGNYIYMYVYDKDGTLLYDRTVNITSISTPLQCAFGVTNSSGSFINPFDGSIDLKETYINTLNYDSDNDTATATRVWVGAKSALNCFDTEANWQNSVTTYGVCGKFVYDSVSNTVRLPKYGNQMWTGGGEAPVVGNGMALGLTDGTTTAALMYSNNLGVSTYQNGYGSSVGSSATSNGISNKIASITTDTTKSGIIAQLSNITTSLNGYYYIVVATSTKTDVQVDIDNIATDLNGKADVDGSNMVNSVKNFDGQWVNSYLQLASSVAISTSADQTYSLSSYLPNDGYNYEVLVGANITVTTNSKFCNIYAHTDLISGSAGIVGGSKSGTNYSFYSCGSAVLIVGTGRTITIIKGSSTNSEGTYILNVYGYRRIGTNQ